MEIRDKREPINRYCDVSVGRVFLFYDSAYIKTEKIIVKYGTHCYNAVKLSNGAHCSFKEDDPVTIPNVAFLEIN